MHNLTLPILAVTSLFIGAYSSVDTAIDLNSPPAIEGWAIRVAPVVAGQNILVPWHIIKRTGCPGESSRVWNGEGGFYLVEASRKTALPMNEIETSYRIPTEVPMLAPEGDLLLRIDGYYDCPDRDRIEFSIGPVELKVENK